MTIKNAMEYMTRYLHTMNGEYISEDNIPSHAEMIVLNLIEEINKEGE